MNILFFDKLTNKSLLKLNYQIFFNIYIFNENLFFDLSYEGKKKPKSKQKELEMLTEQYNKLKKQNEEYEKKINNYKKI